MSPPSSGVGEARLPLTTLSKFPEPPLSALGELVAMCEENTIPLIVFFRRSHPDENRPLFEDVVHHIQGFPVKDMGPWYQGLDESSLVLSKGRWSPQCRGPSSDGRAHGRRYCELHIPGEMSGEVVCGQGSREFEAAIQ